MEADSKKLIIELLKLASKFCFEASEIVTGYARREEILRRDPALKETISSEKEKTEKNIEKPEKNSEKGKKKSVKVPTSESPEKSEKEEQKKKEKKGKSHRKNTSKLKSGYHLFLKQKIKELKNQPECKDWQIGDYSKLAAKQWEDLDITEREIWEENSKEELTEKKFSEIIPQKTSRNEDIDKGKKSKKKVKSNSVSDTDSDSSSGVNAKKKKKSSN
ncbi:hypothetical protein SteCoe_30472 [Stentor coeruleus]|uniref:Uncharacterized protein n=1 Tax=Stentor coeruleus TaxID=5963 RepID=A0A1R2B3I2_9CILI|nr:hypothetical protein SteCoe_30472 [Stentor coeruleus]